MIRALIAILTLGLYKPRKSLGAIVAPLKTMRDELREFSADNSAKITELQAAITNAYSLAEEATQWLNVLNNTTTNKEKPNADQA